MTLFENLMYLSFGIAYPISVQTSTGMEYENIEESNVTPIVRLYSQNYYPSTTTAYTVKDNIGFPNRNYMQRYKAISESAWFQRAYKGKSLGDYIEVDN
jgi:hypothetical protein